ncbi:MAG: PAS domain S-box protein [Prosthecobacter sp.]|jgi:PAS domain S-box-containing protein|uniref:PAS domain-containing sensor histidine kinase n=1 Tax=Prosthecobacter sp. TaxID=1965333 RepID=UPI0019DC9595|nr:histidine kinase [Prosthecobacter sp.]MBE2284107.1 PAS domain S-box protein [Prosthecobacter sp.]
MSFNTLQFRLSALMFGFGLVLVGMSIARQYKRDVESRVQQVRIEAYQEGTRLASLAQHFFRRGLPQSADLAISYASVQPDLMLGVITDGEDIIRNATQKQWRGMSLWDSPLAISPHLIREAKKKSEGAIAEDFRSGRLTAIFPFMDVKGEMKQGLVVLEYDLKAVFAAAVNHAWHESLVQACLLSGGCLLLWSLLRLLVTERVALIVEQTRHIGPDENVAGPIPGDDELAIISKSIEEAAHRLKDSEWRFSQIASNMRDLFWVAPPDGEPIYVNKAYETLFGRPASRLMSHRWDWLKSLPREDVRPALSLLRQLRREPGEMEVALRLQVDGRTEWLRCRGFSTTRHGEEDILQVAGVAAVITAEKDMERHLLEAAENERRRIGRDLHDDVCQRLAAAQLKCGVLGASLESAKHPQAALAAMVARELAEATEVARGYARGLAPVVVGAQELPEALEDLRKFLERGFNVSCRLSCEDVSEMLKPQEAAQIYRIAQELATNAAKHGGGTWVAISLMHDRRVLRLEVANDGNTFDPGSRTRKRGMGLHLLRQRADALGAALTFQPLDVARGGTLAICEMPLAQ